MFELIRAIVEVIDKINRIIGRATMYMIFVMVGVLFYSAISKAFTLPALWTLEMAQFLMMAYFFLGGPYSMQLGGHVRMDLLYGSWSDRTKAIWDAFTVAFLAFYLVLLLYGAVSSTIYAVEYGERSFSPWQPYMWPIKSVMVFGVVLMLLQATSQFIKDLAAAAGKPLS